MKQARKAHQRLAFVPVPNACLWDHQFLWMSEDVGENSGVGLHKFRCISIYAIYAIYEHCQKISCLFVQALGTGTKANL
jgi:hypothetical protein